MTETYTEAVFWNDLFGRDEHAYGVHPNDFLRENIALFQKGDEILSLAEGEGRNAVFLARHQCRVTGVDFSAEGRKKAIRLAGNRNVTIDYDLADLTAYDMGTERWDGIVSLFCHLHEQHRPALFQSIKRALKPEGIFLMECYNKRQLEFGTGGPDAISHLPSLGELEQEFVDFQSLSALEVERDVREGACHNGMSSVIRFVVRKIR